MSSLLTNVSAMSALRVLHANDAVIRRTQGQMATGLKVASAQDNAAYWSIATTMKTEVGKLQAVDDGLDLVSGILSTTSSALSQILTLTQGIAKDLVTAQGSGVDPASLAADIAGKQQGIVTAGKSASFNGVNWLMTKNTNVYSEFTNITWGGTYAEVYEDNGATPIAYSIHGEQTTETVLSLGGASTGSVTKSYDNSGSYIPATQQFSNVVTGPLSTTSTGTPTDFTKTDILFSPTDLQTIDLQPFALFEGNIDLDGGADFRQTFTDGQQDLLSSAFPPSRDATTPTGGYALDRAITLSSGTTTLLTFDPTHLSKADLAVVGKAIYVALTRVQSTMTAVAGLQSEVDGTKSLDAAIADALSAGIGTLVDADLDQVSTRFAALQTQRDLGTQSLAIANSTSQMVLKLFS